MVLVTFAPMNAHDSGLVRVVGRWTMAVLMINAIIGAGIFGLPSKIHALAPGSYGLLAFAACALMVAAIGLCFAEVSSRFTLTGGPYLYAHTAFGPLVGFLVGWLMWVTRATALAVISNVLASYMSFFWPPAASGWGRAAAIGAAVISLTIVNLISVRRAAGTAGALTIGKLIPLLLFVGIGIFFIDTSAFAPSVPLEARSFSQAVLQLIFAFGGFEAAVITAGELKDPRRDFPFALFVGIACATGIYVLVQAVCVGTLPGLATSEKPLADASARFMGSIGGGLIALGALVSTMGTLCGSLIAGPRVLYALAEQKRMPAVFARTHPRFRTPYVAILLTCGTGLALAISGTFTYLVGLNVLVRLATYLSTAAALLVLRRAERDHPAAFRVPAAGLVVPLTCAACVWLITKSGVRELRDAAIASGIGLFIYLAFVWRRGSAPVSTK